MFHMETLRTVAVVYSVHDKLYKLIFVTTLRFEAIFNTDLVFN